jgi:hypothetical protein
LFFPIYAFPGDMITHAHFEDDSCFSRFTLLAGDMIMQSHYATFNTAPRAM